MCIIWGLDEHMKIRKYVNKNKTIVRYLFPFKKEQSGRKQFHILS